MVLLHGDKFHWLRHRESAGVRSETRCRRRPLLEQMEPRALLSSVMGISAGGSVADVGLVTPREALVAARSPLVDQTSSTVTITAQPNQDAAAFINFDLKADPNIQQPDSHVLDLNQGYPGPSVRLAPPGTRDDSLRPVPGVIEETRTVIELDLAQLQGIDPTRIESVMLNVNVNDIRMTLPDGTVVPLTSGVFLVRGFDGDGTPTIDDFGSINATSPDLGFAFNPPPMTDLGVVNISSFSAGPITTNLDITEFVRDLVSRGVPYAGINLKMDYGSLPPRTSLSGDTTFAIDTISADALGGQYAPNLVVTVAPISTQTEVVSSPNPSAFGGDVTFTATVKPNSGTATPTGTVEFLDGGA